MLVAALQFDVRTGDLRANLAAAERGLERAAQEGVKLVVLPEMWSTSFTPRATEADLTAAEAANRRLAALSGELDLVVLGSSYGASSAADGVQPCNRLTTFEGGRALAHYDKVHLFSPTAESASFTAGATPPPVVSTAAGLVAGMVCYDLRFPELCAELFRAGTLILAVCAQWPVARQQHWRALAVGRAVEGQCFVVACNRTGTARIGRRGLELSFPGNSLIVDPHGTVLAEGDGTEGLVRAAIDPRVALELRRLIPVREDARPELYREWL